MMDEEEGWSDLPYHIVELIMNKLMTADDYIRCGTVCTSWRTIFIDRQHHPPPDPDRVHVTLPPPPVLVVPTPKENKRKKKKKTKSLSFYSIISKKVINQFQVTIPNNMYFRGSSYGWLVAVDNDCHARLFNPFLSPSTAYNNNHEILLPSLKHLPYYPKPVNPPLYPFLHLYCTHNNSPSSYPYLRKPINPLSNPIDYIVMVIFGPSSKLAFCKPGHHDKTWTFVDSVYDNYDLIYYKGNFFVLQLYGEVVVLDPTRNMMAVTLEIHSQSRLMDMDMDVHQHYIMYLVELEGVLLQVLRMVEAGDKDIVMKRKPYLTASFQVFEVEGINDKNFDITKVNEHQDGMELNLKLMKDLRGHTLFLGDNDSICVRASDYPGCRPNCIYFTDDFLEMYHGMVLTT